MMLIFRKKLITVFKNLVMILRISGVAISRQIFSSIKENVQLKRLKSFRTMDYKSMATHMKVNMTFHNSYFIFGGSQVT